MRIRAVSITATLLLFAAAAEAHVTIQPRESKPGASETYKVRVPTEGKVATTFVELEVPDGMVVTSVEGATDTRDLKKSGDRIVSITWKTDIAPGTSQEFLFVATNPSTGTEIAWKAHQRYSDGTSTDWVEPAGAGSRRPGPVTKLTAAR